MHPSVELLSKSSSQAVPLPFFPPPSPLAPTPTTVSDSAVCRRRHCRPHSPHRLLMSPPTGTPTACRYSSLLQADDRAAVARCQERRAGAVARRTNYPHTWWRICQRSPSVVNRDRGGRRRGGRVGQSDHVTVRHPSGLRPWPGTAISMAVARPGGGPPPAATTLSPPRCHTDRRQHLPPAATASPLTTCTAKGGAASDSRVSTVPPQLPWPAASQRRWLCQQQQTG